MSVTFCDCFATAICKNGWSQSLEQSAETQPDAAAKDSSNLPRSGEISLKIDALVTPLAVSNNYAGNVLVANGEKILFSRSYGEYLEEVIFRPLGMNNSCN